MKKRNVEAGLRGRITVLEKQIVQLHTRNLELWDRLTEKERPLKEAALKAFNEGVAAADKLRGLKK